MGAVTSPIYTSIRVTRLNKDLVAVQVAKSEETSYIVYDSQLRYVGSFSFGDTWMGFSHYLNNESIFTGFTRDEGQPSFERQAVLLGVR
jgi:hypothetical protein